MSDPTHFHLQVTAGPSYDPATHKLVPVNTEEPIDIDSEYISAKINVRIQNFRGIPSSSPETSPYFSSTQHASDLYSISFEFTPKHDINGDDLLFGNDFEKPIRDNLPPGFGTALRLVRWTIDPGLDGDVYADHPYLYGPLLSSINTLWIGDGPEDSSADDTAAQPNGTSTMADTSAESAAEQDQDELEASQTSATSPDTDADPGPGLSEGGTPSGTAARTASSMPPDSAARMKHFLTPAHRAAYTFAAGRAHACDFFNPYLDFNDLSLKLPGISLQLMRFWDGQPLRYTLKERRSADGGGGGGGGDGVDRELLVVVFTLVPREEVAAHEARWMGRPVDQTGVGGGGGGGGSNEETSLSDVD